MSQWTEQEFDRVAKGTRLSERSLSACRDVLVHGMSGIDAAALHKVFAAQISRSIGILRDHQVEMLANASSQLSNQALLRFTAGEAAKQIAGQGLAIKDAQTGHTYEGPMIVRSNGFAVQKCGRIGVIHDLGMLDGVPALDTQLTITYPKDGGKATIVGKPKELGMSGGVAR